MGFNLGKELNKLKEFAIDAAPYVATALPFTPWGATLKGMSPDWLQGIMKTKFMNSVMGASLKDAGLSYAMAKMQGKRNPHLIAKNALLRNMFINANKVGWDMNMMMGESPTIDMSDYTKDVTLDIPAEMGTRMGPGYEEYGQSMMDKWYGPGRGGVDLEALTGAKEGILEYPTTIGDYYKDWTPIRSVDEANKITGGYTFPKKSDSRITGGWEGIDLPERGNVINWMEEPAKQVTKTVIPDALETFEQIEKDRIHPLEGTGFLTTTKTKPSWMDKLLKRSEEAKDLGITAGTDAYDEFYGIGETRPDMAKMFGLGYDFFVDPLTDPQIERDEQEEFERKMARLMWPRSMDDIPDFQKGFLGYKNGGLASLANGGRIGYQGGGIGPTGATLEETPMAARKDVTIKSQLEDMYKMWYDKGLLTPGLAKLLGWDDPNEYYNSEFMQRRFGDPDTSFMNTPADEMAYDPEGAGPMTPISPMDFDDDFIFDEGAIGQEGTFADEFEGYLDLAGGLGTKEPWEIRAEIEAMQSYLLLEQDPAKREILEIRLNELIGQLGTTPSAARGGRMGYYGGGDLDIASGPDNQGIHDAYEDYLMNGGTLDFEDWKISIQEVMNPEDWAASRGGKTPKMYGGGDLNAIPGGMVSGPGTETSDSVPAQLSNNEFVVTADAVRAAGGGDIDLGAQKFYGIMNALDPNSAKLGEPPVYS